MPGNPALDYVVQTIARAGFTVHGYFIGRTWPRRSEWLVDLIEPIMMALVERRRHEYAFDRPPPRNGLGRIEYEFVIDDAGTLVIVVLEDEGQTLFNIYLSWN